MRVRITFENSNHVSSDSIFYFFPFGSVLDCFVAPEKLGEAELYLGPLGKPLTVAYPA